MAAAVSVATLWTNPEAVRAVDEPALQRPAQIREWLKGLTLEEQVNLSDANRVQTQILYGTTVLVTEEREGWVRVLVPQQGTRKDALGYPGWVPRSQLVEADLIEGAAGRKRAEVVSDKCWLYRDLSEPLLELSFLTSLPVLDESSEGWVKVQAPEGIGFVRADEVRLIDGPVAQMQEEGHIGRSIVEQGKRFLGLPYLWGGMSSYGYDCSGFAYSMHRAFGILIPRDASDQARQGALVEKEQLEPGDLLFFAHEEGKGSVHHVGIYAGDGRMIHSPESGKCVEIVDLSTYRLAAEHCVSRRYWG